MHAEIAISINVSCASRVTATNKAVRDVIIH